MKILQPCFGIGNRSDHPLNGDDSQRFPCHNSCCLLCAKCGQAGSSTVSSGHNWEAPLFLLAILALVGCLLTAGITGTITNRSISAADGVFYDFVAGAPHASWSSGAGSLAFGGKDADSRGFALYRDNWELEDNSTRTRVLETHPQWVSKGWISGRYPEVTVPAGAELRVTLGFLKGATGSDGATFQVRFLEGQESHTIVSHRATYDGELDTITRELSSLAGHTGSFILSVNADEGSAQDWAAWVEARIGAGPGIEIDVQTADARPPATFKGEGNFIVSARASAPAGIRTVSITGEYAVSYFRSDETGRLEGITVGSPHPVRKECSGSSCEVTIPYYEGGKSISFDLTISARDNADNSVETTYRRTFPDEPGDLTLVTAEPVQVIYGAPLVRDKNTAFRAIVNSSFPYPVETYFRLTLPPDKWRMTNISGRSIGGLPPGWTFPDLWGPIKIPANARLYQVMLPIIADWQRELSAGDVPGPGPTYILRGGEVGGIFGVDVRKMPAPVADQVQFSIEVDPGNEVSETDEGGNTCHSPSYTVVKTRSWRFLVVPYQDERGCVPDLETVEDAVKRYLEYLLAVYPIADSRLEYAFAPRPYSQECADPALRCEYVRTMNRGANELRSWVATLAAAEGFDFGIAVGCSGGQANYEVMAVTVGASGGDELLAHEFNHAVAPVKDAYALDCYASWHESYCELPDGDRFYCCWQDYDDEKERREANGVDPRQGCIVDCGQNEAADCDSGCCGTRCRTRCDELGGTVWRCPDGRPGASGMMPAADGWWVNKWIDKSGKQYFMDGPRGDNWISARSMREEGYHFCPEPDAAVDNDGYLNMLTHFRFVRATDPEGLLVSGTINSSGTASLAPFVYLPEAFLDIEPGAQGHYYIVLLGNNDQVLARTGFEAYFHQSDPDGGPTEEQFFAYRMEWKDGTRKIELQDSTGKVLASREVSENRPAIELLSPEGGEFIARGEKIRISWAATDEDGDVLTYSLALSVDGGETWLPFDIGITGNEYELDSSGLDIGASYLVKVRATDGVNATEDVSDGAFTVRKEEETRPDGLRIPGGRIAIAGLLALVLLGVMILAIRRRGRGARRA